MKHAYVVVFSCALSLAVWPAASGQSLAPQEATATAATTASQSPEDVARLLVQQGKAVPFVAAKGKVKHEIKEDEQQFRLPFGGSPAALFELPQYTSPYTLRVVSTCNCFGFRKSIFVPSGVFLDAELKETHKFEEDELTTKQPGFSSGLSCGAAFKMNDERKTDRYLLIYTRADLLGMTAERGPQGLLIGISIKRSAYGTLVLQTSRE